MLYGCGKNLLDLGGGKWEESDDNRKRGIVEATMQKRLNGENGI